MFVVYILFVILSVLWLYWLWTRRNLYILSWKMPGPPVYIPIVGNILSMWNEEGLSMDHTKFSIVALYFRYVVSFVVVFY